MLDKPLEEKLKNILMPKDAGLPQTEAEIWSDVLDAFKYGLGIGVIKPKYANRLLQYLAFDRANIFNRMGPAMEQDGVSFEKRYTVEMTEFLDVANEVEANVIIPPEFKGLNSERNET